MNPVQPPPAIDLRRRKDRDVSERVIGWALFTCAAISTIITVGIVAVLLTETVLFFGKVSPLEFFTGTVWTPLFENPSFGVLPLLAGSFLVAGGGGPPGGPHRAHDGDLPE